MKKHYLMSETAKATHSSSRARMISGSLHQMRSSDDGDTSGTINIFFFKKKSARKKQRDCAPTSFSAVLIMSQSTLDMSTFWQSFGYGIKIKQSTSGANAQKRGASVA